jgi:hypothetical protein
VGFAVLIFSFVVIAIYEPLLPFPFFEKIHELTGIHISFISKPTEACLTVILPVPFVRISFSIFPKPLPMLHPILPKSFVYFAIVPFKTTNALSFPVPIISSVYSISILLYSFLFMSVMKYSFVNTLFAIQYPIAVRLTLLRLS